MAAALPLDERALVRHSWELACVRSFLDTFSEQLELSDDLLADMSQPDALEQALCEQTPLLRDVHEALLQAMHPRTVVRSWKAMLAAKLAESWEDLGAGDNPFEVTPAEAEASYDSLRPLARVRALRALCELHMDRVDLWGPIDDEVEGRTGRQTEAVIEARPADYQGVRCLLGADNRGARYFVSAGHVYRERSRTGPPRTSTLVSWDRSGRAPLREETEVRVPGLLLLEGFEVVATDGCASITAACASTDAALQAHRCCAHCAPCQRHLPRREEETVVESAGCAGAGARRASEEGGATARPPGSEAAGGVGAGKHHLVVRFHRRRDCLVRQPDSLRVARGEGRSRRERPAVSYADFSPADGKRTAMRPESDYVRRGRSAGQVEQEELRKMSESESESGEDGDDSDASDEDQDEE